MIYVQVYDIVDNNYTKVGYTVDDNYTKVRYTVDNNYTKVRYTVDNNYTKVRDTVDNNPPWLGITLTLTTPPRFGIKCTHELIVTKLSPKKTRRILL